MMRLLPRSLSRRLLVTAGIAIILALALSAMAISHVLERFVMHSLDERLDAQIEIVSRAVAPDGLLDPARAVDLPPFDQPGSGWAWEVRGPNGTLRSGSLGNTHLALPPGWDIPPRWGPVVRRWGAPWDEPEGPRPLDGRDAGGQRLHYRIVQIPLTRGVISIVAAGPRRIVERPLHFAIFPLLFSLLLLGTFLSIALVVQLRIGLRPLNRLTYLVAEVRDGQRRHIDVDEPTELLPLVRELNALILANEQALERARGHVANLAHGLKTPLATLRLDLADPNVDPDGRLEAQVGRMEGQIRHHLGRARAAETGGTIRAPMSLSPCLTDLVEVMRRIHAEKGLKIDIDVPDDVLVRCDPQDLDELLGNLLDNGWRWARSTVAITVRTEAGYVGITIEDDGPGMSEGEISEALIKGRRLDEREAGHGFGLSISRELAELHGGSLSLARSALGGLGVEVRLPRGRSSSLSRFAPPAGNRAGYAEGE